MRRFFIACLLGLSTLTGLETVRTVPVMPTPESNSVALKIAIPREGQIVGKPVWVQFRIDGYALGSASQFERASEIGKSDMGQTVHVVVDNYPYFAINEPALDPFDESGYYYDMSYKFEVPYRLSEGAHILRMFPARSYGESLKNEGTFAAIQFYVGSDTGGKKWDLSSPYITYNEPSNQIPLSENKPILLDFYVSNTELSPDGYKVRLTIDGKVNRMITLWQPYYIYGLKRGKHTIQLELLDSKGKLVPGPLSSASHSIQVD